MDRDALFRRGLFQGNDETEVEFAERIARAPMGTEVDLTDLFGFKIDWMEVEEGQKGLMPWHGGGTWIGEGRARVRIRKGLNREEILKHEAVHVARMGFKEGRFEEIFAYMTSEKKWRRILGPLFREPWHAYLFLGSSLLSFFFYPLPLIVLFLLGVQLIRDRRILSRCLRNLEQKYDKPLEVAIRLSDEEIALLSNSLK